MQEQTSLFNQARHADKQVDGASRDAYSDLAPTLGEKQRRVLRALDAHIRLEGTKPTAYELLRFMQRWVPALDLNDVRPRLTELKEQELVEKVGRRDCKVTQKSANEWALTDRGSFALQESK
jgi:hypothetical protein